MKGRTGLVNTQLPGSFRCCTLENSHSNAWLAARPITIGAKSECQWKAPGDCEKACSCHFTQTSKFAICVSACGLSLPERESGRRRRWTEREGELEMKTQRKKMRQRGTKWGRESEKDTKETENQWKKNKKCGLIVWPGLFSRIHQSLLLSPPIQMSRAEIALSSEQKAFFLIIAVMPLTADWLTMRQPRGAWSAQLISCRTIVRGGFHSCTRAHARTCYAPSELRVGACDAFSTCWKLNYPDTGMPFDWKM